MRFNGANTSRVPSDETETSMKGERRGCSTCEYSVGGKETERYRCREYSKGTGGEERSVATLDVEDEGVSNPREEEGEAVVGDPRTTDFRTCSNHTKSRTEGDVCTSCSGLESGWRVLATHVHSCAIELPIAKDRNKPRPSKITTALEMEHAIPQRWIP